MPRRDGTGPPQGGGRCTGRGMGRGGKSTSRMGGSKAGAGPGGECICPNCGNTVVHRRGTSCFEIACPNCGAIMVRK